MNHPELPSYDQCDANERLPDFQGCRAYACYYPQMGGYIGRCVVVLVAGGCFEAYVWHDGDFPFLEDDGPPVNLHHCCAEQFVEFGKFVLEKQGETQ